MNPSITVPIKRLDKDLPLPSYAYEGDGGVDLLSTIDVTLAPFERALVPTGIAIELPRGYAALVIPRSGLAIKKGLSVVNGPGLIDSNYRGEIGAILINLDPKTPIEIKRGDRIAQMMITQIPFVSFNEVDELGETDRGAGGFGSSGVRS